MSRNVQAVLDILAARTWKAPGSYLARDGMLSTGELDQLVAKLREADDTGNYPLTIERDEYRGKNWLVATADGFPVLGFGNNHENIPVYVTTDHVHGSEIRGGADEDAQCYVTMRNSLPRIIAALEELLARRLEDTPFSGGSPA